MEVRKSVIGAEVRAAGDFVVVGKALSYGKQAPNDRLGKGYTEMIAAGAFREWLGTSPDVKCLKNHNPDLILGRTKSSTLTLQDGPDALRFRVQLDKSSQAHRDIYAQVQRGDLNECSFAFVCHSEAMQPGTDGQQVRVVKKADLLDVSIVTYPFYSDEGSTGAEARAAAVNKTHGVLEAVAVLRKASQSIVFFRADSGPMDFASHLTRCHEHAELAGIMAERCYAAIGDDEDVDPDDEVLRRNLRMALASVKMTSEYFAQARLRHAANVAKKAKKK